METYRLVIDSQEAFFVLPTGEKFLYAITKGKIFLPHSDIAGVFQHLSTTVAGSANELPLKLISDMGSVEKLSADYKGSVISFTTTLSIDEIKDAIEMFFAYRIPPRQTAPAPEIQYRGGGLARTTFC